VSHRQQIDEEEVRAIAQFYAKGFNEAGGNDDKCRLARSWLDLRVKNAQLQVKLDRAIVDETAYDEVTLTQWRNSIMVRAVNAGLPEGMGLCTWFEQMAKKLAQYEG
jgi:hypothetical protein